MKKSERAIVKSVKEVYKQATGKDLALSDEITLGVLERAGDTFDGMSDEDKIAFLSKAADTAKAVAVVDPGISVLVAKFDDDDKAQAELVESIDAIIRNKLNTVVMYADFKRIYTKEELDSMPYPGTDKDTLWLGNHKPDIVKTQASTGEEITVQWTHDFVDKMRLGKAYADTLDDIKKEENQMGSSSRYKNWGTQDLQSAKSDATTRRNALRSVVKRTIELHHQFEGVNGMPLVNIMWVVARQGNDKNAIAMPKEFGKDQPTIKVTAAPKNLWITPKDEPMNGKLFSVSQLNQFEIATAIKNGGTMAALTATAKKAPKTPDAAKASGDGSSMTIDEAYSNTARTCNYFGERPNVAEINKILADPKHKDHKDWVQMIGGLWSSIYPLAKRVRAEYEKANETKMEGLDKAVAA